MRFSDEHISGDKKKSEKPVKFVPILSALKRHNYSRDTLHLIFVQRRRIVPTFLG
jgi:hypothetical protein